MRTFIIIIAILALYFIFRFYYRNNPLKTKQIAKRLLLIAAGAGFLFLLLTGRMHWLFALAAAAVPFFRRLLPLLRYVPMLSSWLHQYQARKNNVAGPSAGQTSSVNAKYLNMSLNHDSGEMDGIVMQGVHQNSKLSALSLEQLLQLLEHWQDDNDSVALLCAYLDRHHPDWQQHAQADSTQNRQSSATLDGEMSKQEALSILGLPSDADDAQVINAHRRLMQKMHPDRGGSTYLSAKINQAKDLLLK